MTCVELGNKIRELRERHGLTREQLAGAAEISAKTLWEVETGRTATTIAILARVARQLGVEPWELLAPASGSRERSWLAFLASLDKDEAAELDLLRSMIEDRRLGKSGSAKRSAK